MVREFDPEVLRKISQESVVDEDMRTQVGIKPKEEEPMPSDLRVELGVVQGPDKGAAFTALETPIFIGRTKDASVTLSDYKVSRKHAVILYKNHRFFLIDLGSTNGTFVNGVRVEGVPIRSGDLLQFGDTVLSFEVLKR